MSRHLLARLAAVALVFQLPAASAAPLTLDLPTALDRAHRLAPAVAASRGHVAEARASVVGARAAFATNPVVEGGLGPRLVDGHPLDAELRIEQPLDLGRRGPRRARATSEVALATAEQTATLRQLDLDVSLAFYDAVYATAVVELARTTELVAASAAAVAARRRAAGELTDLDVGLARSSLGRARAATHAALAEAASATGRLAALVGADPDVTVVVRGDLATAGADPIPLDDPDTRPRPDLVALDRERALAAARADEAATERLPELGAWVAYQREDRSTILLGGFSVTLPVWNRGQGDYAAARARERRVTEVRESLARGARRARTDLAAAYAEARLAVATDELDVLPLLDATERLLELSLATGTLAVGDYLVARQELLAGRREHLARQLALVKAALAVRYGQAVAS